MQLVVLAGLVASLPHPAAAMVVVDTLGAAGATLVAIRAILVATPHTGEARVHTSGCLEVYLHVVTGLCHPTGWSHGFHWSHVFTFALPMCLL
jgi:hypothetical protein